MHVPTPWFSKQCTCEVHTKWCIGNKLHRKKTMPSHSSHIVDYYCMCADVPSCKEKVVFVLNWLICFGNWLFIQWKTPNFLYLSYVMTRYMYSSCWLSIGIIIDILVLHGAYIIASDKWLLPGFRWFDLLEDTVLCNDQSWVDACKINILFVYYCTDFPSLPCQACEVNITFLIWFNSWLW